MARESKFADEQKLEIVLGMLNGELSHGEVCRKFGISATYAYKLKDRALEVLRAGIGRPAGKPDAKVERLQKRVADLEQLAGDQALLICAFKKEKASGSDQDRAVRGALEHSQVDACGGRAGLDGGCMGETRPWRSGAFAQASTGVRRSGRARSGAVVMS